MLKTGPYLPRAEEKAATNQVVGGKFVFFLLLHIPLALLMGQSELFATAHALITVGLGGFWALLGKNERVISALGYIAGAEVLWRMTNANVFWEFGKYATVFIILISILKGRKHNPPAGLLLYLVLLLPSIVLTLTEQSLDQARQGISFNLSGPLAVFMCAWFFTGRELDTTSINKMVWAVIAPLAGIVTIAWSMILTTGIIVFSTESNFQTSGGYGPNQVSAVLGMGIFLIFVALMMGQKKSNIRNILFLLFLAYLTEVFLTFSRTGAYITGISIMAMSLIWVKSARERFRVIFIFGLLLLISILVIFPFLESYTGGYFYERFTDANLTGRDSIIKADFNIWQEHFFFGVGPGLAGEYRSAFYQYAAAHTEFSRMLAEHGLLGLIALLIFLGSTFLQVIRSIKNKEGAIKLGNWVFILMFMTVSAIRLVAPAFMLGILFVKIRLDSPQANSLSKSLP